MESSLKKKITNEYFPNELKICIFARIFENINKNSI